MNEEMLAVLTHLERLGLERDVVIQMVEKALVPAVKRHHGPYRQLRVEIDKQTGDIRAFSTRVVVEAPRNFREQVALAEARRLEPRIRIGDELEMVITHEGFGRFALRHAVEIIKTKGWRGGQI